jgi:hypothetical protein
MTDGHSAYPSWCRAPLWDPWLDFSFSFRLPDNCFALRLGAPSLTIGRVCNFVVQSVSGQSRGGLIIIITVSSETTKFPFLSPPTTRRDYGWSILTRLHTALPYVGPELVEVQVTLRPTASQSVSMSWYRAPLWDLRPDITSCRNVAVWNLRSCVCGAASLTRGRVCNFQCNHLMVVVAQNP